MKKVNSLLSICLAASMMVYTGCKEKETPVPTENTARMDALRAELRSLQQQLLGENAYKNILTMTNEELEAEVEKLKKEMDRNITYTVYATDLQGVFLTGAKVNVVVNGQIVSKETDAEGKAVFENVRSGMINGVISHGEFTTANYTASIAFGEDFVSTKVPMLPLSGNARTITVEGNLYADMSDADDNMDYSGDITNIQGATVRIEAAEGQSGNSTKWDGQARKITFVPVLKAVPSTSGFGHAGDIQRIAYENAVYQATSAADGSFSIKLPALVNANNELLAAFDSYKITVEEFSADKTFLTQGTTSSNAAYSNDPFNLYRNRATSTTDLPESTNGFVKLKTYTEKRFFRMAPTELNDEAYDNLEDLKMGEKTKVVLFYSEYKN